MAIFETYYYEDGNTVRKTEAVALPTRETRAQEEREHREHIQRVRRRKNVNALRTNRLHTLYFAAGMIALAFLFVSYVRLQNDITTHMSHISSLKNEIADLKAENRAKDSRISTKVNLSEVKKEAMEKLNMVYASDDKIVYYDLDDADYMDQYDAIP